ncbi:NHL repeat-containing protein [Granulicella rosea]|uniref:NHL repeat-containing protein n=1 Tax=Granulicella rosea TaxID=474952 RepID=A0A239DWJ6_9BACT|nr:Ig-like domain repeat protein [Granulicella rosea]SNS35974.1 NHL repeat-containing protein [Granulicella rosea]
MRISKMFIGGLATLALFAVATQATAQTTAQAPFLSVYAGIPTGSTATACANDIPTFTGTHVGDGCVPTQASLSTPSSSAIDVYGNVYISDYGHKLLRVIYQGGAPLTSLLVAASPAISNFVPVPGRIYTIAGAAAAVLATTGTPKALYCNSAGTGTVAIATNGDGCPATESYIQPRGISVDANGNIFFANLGGGEGMRVIYAGGAAVATLITTLNSTVTAPQVGYIYSITGSSTAGFKGDGANARTAQFENVRDVVVDPSGNLYISDGNAAGATTANTNNNIREINAATGIITTIAGNTVAPVIACPAGGSFGGDGGPATAAQLNSPYAMFMDANSNLYLSDSCNGRLRVIYAGGTIPNVSNPVVGDIYTVAGGGALTGGATNVAATQLSIALMQSAGIDAAGNLYIADNTNRYVWQINPITGIATLFSGLGLTGTTAVAAPAAGTYCGGTTATSGPKSVDTIGDGCPALQTAVSPSLRFIGDNLGHVYSIDNSVLRQYTLDSTFPATAVGSSTTQPVAFTAPAMQTDSFKLEGTTATEFSDVGGTACTAVASIPASTLCVYNVQFTPTQSGPRDGAMVLGAGLATALLSGSGTAAQLSVDPGTQTTLGSGLTPQGIVADDSGNVYVADARANQLVAINIAKNTSTTVMTGLSKPGQAAIDGAGNLYVADAGNNRIAELPVGGAVRSLGAGLSAPQGVAVDGVGNLYIADTGNNRIVEIVAGGQQRVLPFSGLAQPTRIAVDGAGDLFVADTGNSRVVEWIAGQGQTVVSFGTTSVKPAGLAVDAAGNLYVADTNSLQVLEVLAGTTTVNTLVSGLKSPADLSIGPNASLYVADSQATAAIALNRSLGAIGFPITNVGENSSASISVANTGNAALSFTGATLVSNATGVFTVAAASANGCALSQTVAAGASCLLNATFAPTSRGAYSQIDTFTTNAANSGSVQALLAGTGAQLIGTTTAITITSPTTSTIGFGTPVVLSTLVTLSSNSGAPTGTVTVTVDGQARTPIAFGTGASTLTLNLGVGTHVVKAGFSGDSIYASSSASVSFTVVKATTTTGLTIAASAPGTNPTITFTAAVASSTATGETGTVSFYAGSVLLGTSTLTNNTAVYTTSTLTFASNSFTAVYSGDGNFTGSTSAILQPAADFALTSSSSSLAIAQGGVATANITLTPIFNFAGVITPSCSNLPSNSVCRFQPTSISFSGNTPVGVLLQVYTDVSPSQISLHTQGSSRTVYALFLPLGLLVLCGRRFTTKARRAQLLLAAVAALYAATGLTGCVAHTVTSVTPAGTQSVTVSFTSAGAATPVTHSLAYTLTVNTP